MPYFVVSANGIVTMESVWINRAISFMGLFLLLGFAFALSERRKRIDYRVVAWGVGLQLVVALLVLTVAPRQELFEAINGFFMKFISFSDQGAKFVFGKLTTDESYGASVAFHALPIIIFVSAFAGILYHLGIIQAVVRGVARIMQWTMGTSGAESLGAALFMFLGIESVTAIGEYIKKMTRSELFVIMTAFLATIATSVMTIYVDFGAEGGHLVAASIMSAPAAVAIAKIMIPETGTPATAGKVEFEPPVTSSNVVDAAASGASSGVRLAINIAAMLIAFVGLVHMISYLLKSGTGLFMAEGLGLKELFGYAFSPFAVILGVPWQDALKVGQLLGTKTVLNEFLAYQQMQGMIEAGELTQRSVTISTYALCGFANFGSVAILIGGLSGVAPDRKGEIAALGLKALIGGTLAAFMTACLAGILT